MASPACCKAGPPIHSDYQPKGSIEQLGDLPVYYSGTGPKAIIVVFDIFGFSPQAKQVCDLVADAGFNVAMPDYTRGNPWLLSNFPPSDRDEFMAWIGQHDFDTVLLPDMRAVMDHMKASKGAEVFGALGFCWGGAQVAKLAGTGLVKGAAMAHPGFMTEELAEASQAPLCILPSKEDLDTAPIKAITDKKPFGADCVYQRFDDMHHGWCAARGDWTVPLQAQRASEAIGIFTDFFKKLLA